MKEKGKIKFKTDVITLGKVFKSIERLGFEDIPVFTKEDKFETEFVSTLVLNLAEDPTNLDSFFKAITGEDKYYVEEDFDELCEVAQDFLDNTPKRFKNMLRILIDAQNRQRALAIQEMRKGMGDVMRKMSKEIIPEIPTIDTK